MAEAATLSTFWKSCVMMSIRTFLRSQRLTGRSGPQSLAAANADPDHQNEVSR
jgi:hypothetical protein